MGERILSEILELDFDRCSNTYGVSPCTAAGAAGSECRNYYAGCQDKPNFNQVVHTIKFTGRGSPIPLGELVRPYIERLSVAPTEIDVEQGYARRSATEVTCGDETDSDVSEDPYLSTRAQAPSGTFWGRLLARNPYWFNRPARVVRSLVSGGVWGTARTEKYIVDKIQGPDAGGRVNVTLKDPTKRVDRTDLPKPTDGRVIAELVDTSYVGTVISATATSITFDGDASSVDGFFDGQEVYITNGKGSGQRRTISGYVGATRTGTVATWITTPEASARVEVGPLEVDVGAAYISQYRDPAVTGDREFVRIDAEIIEYTAISGSKLQWADTSYRGAFGSVRDSHNVDATVQQCQVWINVLVGDVIVAILEKSGLAAADIDTTGIAALDAVWFGDHYRITACLSEPTSADDLLEELLPLLHSVVYWDPIEQKVKLAVILPTRTVAHSWTDTSELIEETIRVTRLTELRKTRHSVTFGLRDSTDAGDQYSQFRFTELAIDADAESVNEYGDVRDDSRFSRWFGEANAVAMRTFVRRQAILYRDAPFEVEFDVDPKDAGPKLAEHGTLTTRYVCNSGDGAPVPTRMLITRIRDKGGRLALRTRSTTFEKNYGYIAPNGTADHPTDTVYAHISDNSGVMGDGSDGYLIV